VTEEITKAIEACLEANKNKRAAGRAKQTMRKIDIHSELLSQGFDNSYSTV